MKPLKILINYDYASLPLLCAEMFEFALRKRDDVEVYRAGQLDPSKADLVFNTLPGDSWSSGPLTAWWDIESCNYNRPDQFGSDLVLAPYHIPDDVYPKGKTYLFPFGTDLDYWHACPELTKYDVGFVGREDLDRVKRVKWLDFLQDHVNLLRTNGIPRGEEMSKLLSQAKIILQITGDAKGGVMETRFFECGSIGLLAHDITHTNKEDMEWAAVPDYHFIAYKDEKEMVEKIWNVLENGDTRIEMKTRAIKNIERNHTYDVRARQLLEQIGYLKGKGLPDYHKKLPKWQD